MGDIIILQGSPRCSHKKRGFLRSGGRRIYLATSRTSNALKEMGSDGLQPMTRLANSSLAKLLILLNSLRHVSQSVASWLGLAGC